MKTIGMLGGMSWQSTVSYYRAINEGVSQSLGGLHSAKINLCSVDFNEIEKLQHQNKWAETAKILSNAAQSVEASGADFLLICTNTMHKVATEIEQSISIPLLHIADATAGRLLLNNIKTVGLLGTKFTMEQDFYKGRLADKYGIKVFVPNSKQRETVHNIIYSELCLGIIKESSRRQLIELIEQFNQQGVNAIILGCTEISLLIQQKHTAIPLYDTTEIHANKAVELAISTEKTATS